MVWAGFASLPVLIGVNEMDFGLPVGGGENSLPLLIKNKAEFTWPNVDIRQGDTIEISAQNDGVTKGERAISQVNGSFVYSVSTPGSKPGGTTLFLVIKPKRIIDR